MQTNAIFLLLMLLFCIVVCLFYYTEKKVTVILTGDFFHDFLVKLYVCMCLLQKTMERQREQTQTVRIVYASRT